MAVNHGVARRVPRVTQICAQTLALAMPPMDETGGREPTAERDLRTLG